MTAFQRKEIRNECRVGDVAELVTTRAMDSANVSSLQLNSIQTRRSAFCRWSP